jgi:hypothetical protein
LYQLGTNTLLYYTIVRKITCSITRKIKLPVNSNRDKKFNSIVLNEQEDFKSRYQQATDTIYKKI